ncbi:MAG: PAS domain S-box protein, partial [Chloroflexota bacterium]
MTNRKSRSSTHSLETAAEQSPAGVLPEGKRGLRPYRGAAISATFLAITVLSSGDLIEFIPVFAPFVAGPLFPFVHETHDILAAMLALYVAHKLTPAVGTMAMVWLLALHLPYAYHAFPAHLPELVRIALTGAAAFLGIYIIWLRKRAEDRLWLQAVALRESEKRFRALIENSSDGIALVDADGKVLYDSPSITRILGYAPDERVGRNVFEFIHPDEREAGIERFAGFVQQPEATVNTQGRFRHKDGSWRWIEGVRSNLLNEPSVQAIAVNYRDVTERVQAGAALRESERMRRLV